jgi:hypothetical protein
MFSPFEYAKFAVVALCSGCIVYGPAYLHGKSVARSQIEAEAAKEALERIKDLEQDNANFKSLSDRDRCIVFMRDSGLPDDICQ